MEKELLQQDLGSIGKLDLKFQDGKLIASISIEALDLAIQGLMIAKEKIPGQIDDLLIDSGIAALKALK